MVEHPMTIHRKGRDPFTTVEEGMRSFEVGLGFGRQCTKLLYVHLESE
jgi:hypothetical protein